MRRTILAYCLPLFLLVSCGDGSTAPTVVSYAVSTKTAPPATAVVGATVPVAFTVTETRSDGSTGPTSGMSVTIAVTAGGGTVNGSASAALTTAADGSVSANWVLGTTTGAQTLRASVAASQFIDVSVTATPPPPTQLALTTPPSATAQSGAPFAQQPTVQLRDASGNAVSQASVPVTVAVDGGGGTLTGDALTVNTNASGAAVFGGLMITGTAGPRTLRFSATLNGVAASVTAVVTVGAGPAARLAFSTVPSTTAQSGVALAAQPTVQVQDASGNAVALAAVPVTVALTAGGGTLGGTATLNTNASGAAAFTGLSITGLVGNHTLTFSATLNGTAVSLPATVALTAGPASQLFVTTQPSATAQNGVVLAQQPTVQIRDGGGNPLSLAAVPITVALDGAGTVGGTTTVNSNATGAATFTNLSISGPAGNRTLRFTATLSGASATVASAPIALGAGAASQLTFKVTPAGTQTLGFAMTPVPSVQVSDAFGNAVAQAGVVVTVAQVAGAQAGASMTGSSAMLAGTMTATTDATGAAAFTNLRFIGNPGEAALAFTGDVGGQAQTVTSDNITVARPANGKIVFKRGRGELWVINPDGSGLTQLTPGYGNAVCQRGDELPVWSPDGSMIAFQRTRDNKLEVWKMNADGSNQTQLTFDATVGSGCTGGPQQMNAEVPEWSPDGARIMFSRDASITLNNQDTWIMNADGSGQVKLFGVEGIREGQARFSPDGSTIAYRRTVLTPGCRGTSPGTEIWLANADGTNERQLTSITGCSEETWPDWTADGLQLYITMDAASLSCGLEVHRINVDPANLARVQLTTCVNDAFSKHGIGSPDGAYVVFQNGSGNNGNLYIMRADGSEKRFLVSGTFGSIDDASWQPVRPAAAGSIKR